MGNMRIVVENSEAAASILNRLKPTTNNDAGVLVRAAGILEAIQGGALDGNVRISAGGARATNKVTLASFVATDTITINGVVITGSDTATGQVQVRTGVSDQDTANALVTLVNANTTAKIAGTVHAHRQAALTFASCVNTDTLVLTFDDKPAITFTIKTTPVEGVPTDVLVGADDNAMAENMRQAIINNPSINQGLLTVTRAANVLTLNYYGELTSADTGGTITDAAKVVVLDVVTPGTIGNLCTLAISAHGTVTGANFAGGTEGTETKFTKNRAAR